MLKVQFECPNEVLFIKWLDAFEGDNLTLTSVCCYDSENQVTYLIMETKETINN